MKKFITLLPMFLPIMFFLALIGGKTFLPVFPINIRFEIPTYVFFEVYSEKTIVESMVFCVSFFIIGALIFSKQNLHENVSSLWKESRGHIGESVKIFFGIK